LGIYRLRFIERLHPEAQLIKKPPEMDKDDPRLGFHADANPIRSEITHTDYGLANLRRLSSASNYPDTTALDK
jgi:hypothetical protein